MVFTWPQMLWALLLLPVLVVAYVLLQRRRRRYAIRYGSLLLVKQALEKGPGWRRHVPPAIFLAALGVMLVALARPNAIVKLPAQDATIILTMDVSGSMRADDMKPNRLEVAKEAARAFVERQPIGVNIGVVAFSDNAFLLRSPTSDKEEVIAAINRLAFQRGTAIGSALLTSLDAINENPDSKGDSQGQVDPSSIQVPPGSNGQAVIVLLTDGENTRGPDPLEVMQQVANNGIRVYTIGLGSVEGAVLQNRGRSMRVRLDEETLKAIAEATKGEYFNASSERDLQSIYDNLRKQFVLRTQLTEITALFTAAALALSVVATGLSVLWFNRLL